MYINQLPIFKLPWLSARLLCRDYLVITSLAVEVNMPIVKLTIQTVQSAAPENGCTTVYRDKEVVGFSLKVTPSNTKTFLFQYRLGGRAGTTRRITIGKFPTVKPDDARKIALQYAAEVARKADPRDALKKK